MIWKIIAEAILAILAFSFGANFWDCIKSKGFLKSGLDDYNYLNSWVKKGGKDALEKLSNDIIKDTAYELLSNRFVWIMGASLSALSKARNLMLFFLVLIFTGSYFLNPTFLIINFFISLGVYFKPMSKAAQKNITQDICDLIITVYTFNKLYPKEANELCNNHRMSKTIYRVITELN